MKLRELLLETYVNLWGKEEITKYIDEIWEIMQFSYRNLEGGFATASTKEELINKAHFAKLVRRNGKIVAAKLYSDKHGRKGIATGSDGSELGKQAVYSMIREDMKLGRSWSEVSGSPERLALHYGGIPVPNELAEKFINKPILSREGDGYHYTRKIGDKVHTKMIVVGDKNLIDKVRNS